MKLTTLIVLFASCLAANCQWITQNTTYIVNSTVVHHPLYAQPPRPYPPPPGLARNLTYYPGTPGVNPRGHHLIVGTVGPNDILLLKRTYHLSGRLFTVRDKTVVYPAPGAPYPHYISAIRVWDMKRSDNGGSASIVNGGVGHRNVTIQLVSKRGVGINFTAEIYGG